MNLSPSAQYQHDLLAPDFEADPTQANAIKVLDELYDDLSNRANKKKIFANLFSRKTRIKGAYLWGGVGTGKTYLMNTFFHSLPFAQKKRLHFHDFMRQVHERLRFLQGQVDPLKILAKEWAKETIVICFDEFFVKDIADAMVLGNLLEAFFSQGICLVITSNVQIPNLYQNGLQRERFLPAIKLLTDNMTVLQIDNHIDYRVRHIKPAEIFFEPLDNYAEKMMMQTFHYYAASDISGHDDFYTNGRAIQVVRHAEKVIWFNFEDLCVAANGTEDYLKIAETYSAVMINNIPIFNEKHLDTLVRFINLIDILYDKHILLILSLAAPLEKLYQGKAWSFEFKRTISRLQEMQGQAYLDGCSIH